MGKKDIEAKDYFANTKRFADLFNYYIYQGRSVINPDGLKELDATEITLAYDNKVKFSVQKFRDILKSYAFMHNESAIYLLFGLELEAKTHYAMPARSMLYDAMNYNRQISKIAKMHRDNLKNEKQDINSMNLCLTFGKRTILSLLLLLQSILVVNRGMVH